LKNVISPQWSETQLGKFYFTTGLVEADCCPRYHLSRVCVMMMNNAMGISLNLSVEFAAVMRLNTLTRQCGAVGLR
jgi:hypothetical protein